MSVAALRKASPLPDSLTLYLREIGDCPRLTRDDEARLARRIRQGDQQALDTLVRANLRFVVSVAKKYRNQGVSLVDLINEGNLGLLHAARKFDETRDSRFITYAVWWIRRAILVALADQSRVVRVPIRSACVLARLGRQARRLEQALGREPTHRELAEGLDLSEREVEDAMLITRPPLALDAPPRHTEGEGRSLAELLADDAPPADEATIQRSLGETVAAALGVLDRREARVLRLYYGLEGADPISLEQIGALLGVTRERTRQIKERALQRIRQSGRGRALATFAG